MKKLSIGLSVALAIAAAGALGAQTGSAAAKADQVTVTGCLERAPASNDAAIGTSGTEPGPIYVLMKPAESASDTAGAAGTIGTAARRSKVEYRLQTLNVSELAGYEGAKVEITGTTEGRKESAQPDQKETRTRSTGAPTLKILSIKTISSSCYR